MPRKNATTTNTFEYRLSPAQFATLSDIRRGSHFLLKEVKASTLGPLLKRSLVASSDGETLDTITTDGAKALEIYHGHAPLRQHENEITDYVYQLLRAQSRRRQYKAAA